VLQAMRVMNKRMNLPNMQKILMEFEKQNERMDMTSEMMGDAIDDAMEVRRLLGACGGIGGCVCMWRGGCATFRTALDFLSNQRCLQATDWPDTSCSSTCRVHYA
jgi:hypothetical protein